MALTPETRNFILGSEGFSRREIIEYGKALGYNITVRDVQTARHGVSPETLASRRWGKISEGTQSIRDSWKANREKKGLDPKIRGSKEYKDFKRGIEKANKWLDKLEKGEITRKQYVKKRLDVYRGAGLITQAEYEIYLDEIDEPDWSDYDDLGEASDFDEDEEDE